MAFQKLENPLIEQLRTAIEDLKNESKKKDVLKILKQLDNQFPFLDVMQFIDMYVSGTYSNEIIKKFHLNGQDDFKLILKILEFKKLRKTSKRSSSYAANLNNKNLKQRYTVLKKVFTLFEKQIEEKILYNIFRYIIILFFYTKEKEFSTKKEIFEHLPSFIHEYESIIQTSHKSLSTLSDDKKNLLLKSVLKELTNETILEKANSNFYRLNLSQLKIHNYLFNLIKNSEGGIIFQDIVNDMKSKLPILSKLPIFFIEVHLTQLLSEKHIVLKPGERSSQPFLDEYFTPENWKNSSYSLGRMNSRNRKFYGRQISPDDFVNELLLLDKGDFADQDDQVTRIAGMVLSNSNMMRHSPNDLQDFDFMVDMTNYEFTKEQQKIMKDFNIVIHSNIIYIKIMIKQRITLSELNKYITQLDSRQKNEQGFIISFSPIDEFVGKILSRNKTIQVISKDELLQWCKITPTIPARRGSVCVIRQGDHKNSIVQIKSINYESGLADILFLDSGKTGTHYIGSLEELLSKIRLEKFVDFSNIYFQFLSKLYSISSDSIFSKTILEFLKYEEQDSKIFQRKVLGHEISTSKLPLYEVQYFFKGNTKASIYFSSSPNSTSLKYQNDDLFSCPCYHWNYNSKKFGLCEHIVYMLNDLMNELVSNEKLFTEKKLQSDFENIEKRLDLFLQRLKYCNDDGTIAVCTKCGKTAKTIHEIDAKFGYRKMDKNNKFSLRRQSRCIPCRNQ